MTSTPADRMPLPEPILAELRAIVGAAHVHTRDGDLAAYARDATARYHRPPDAVVFPGSAEEVAAVLRLATAHRIPVVPRGAGTNLAAATVALHGGIVLVLTRLDAILEVSSDELLARVQPGVTTAALAAAAAERGLLYAPDPGSRTVATVGGNVATCAGGLRGLKYGVTRNYVLGLQAVLPTGETIHTGGRLWKDVAGYDLTRLITGSEGTLAVITEVTVALLPGVAASNTGLAYFDDLATTSHAVTAILRAGVVPATLEFLDRGCIGAVEECAHLGLRTDAGALLIFGDDGDPSTVEEHVTRMANACADLGGEVTVAPDPQTAEALLAARRCTFPALSRIGSLMLLEDASVPRPRLAEMVDRIDTIARRHSVRMATFGHAGDGNLHPTCVLDPEADERAIERAEQAFAETFAAALDLGGHHHGRARGRRGEDQVSRRPARRGPDGAAAPDQGGIRPGWHPQSRKAGVVMVHDHGAATATPPSVLGRSGIFNPRQLSRCISCGFCLPACPTYQATRDEAASPRGRITLMRALDRGELAPDDPTLAEQASFCLGCRACEPVCPAGVEYGQLLEQWRDHQWRGVRRPLIARALTLVAARTTLLRLLGRLRRTARRRGSADGPHLLLGCYERILFPRVSRAAVALRSDLDCPSDQGCCGALHAHNGDSATGERLARAMGERLPGTIVSTSGGCAAHLSTVLGRDRVRDLSEAIPAPEARPARPLRVTLQDSCHLRNGLGVWQQPRALLRAVADYVELPGAATCCGAAGTYSLLRRRDSRRILDAKLDEIEAAGVDVVIAVNPGCLRQLQGGLRRRRARTVAMHLAEFLAGPAARLD